MVDKAGLYGGGLEITCILYEGAITVTAGTSIFVENGALGKDSITLAAAISEGDFVGIHVDSANDYDSCGGLPVMQLADATTGWMGIVKSHPVWHKIPSSTQSSWNAARLSNGFYRIATVVMPGVSMAFKSMSFETSVLSGSPVQWDISGDGFKDNGTTFGGIFSFHDASTTQENMLIGVGDAGQQAGGSDADCAGYLMVA